MTEFPDLYEQNNPPEWATMCLTRSPIFKLHTRKNLAHSAIAAHKPHAEIALYHLETLVPTQNFNATASTTVTTYSDSGYIWVPGGRVQWRKTWEYVFPEECDFCKGNFDTQHINWSTKQPVKAYEIPYEYKGRVMDAPVVCLSCVAQQRSVSLAEEKRQRDIERLKALRELYPEV